jgi:hypothetical protein
MTLLSLWDSLGVSRLSHLLSFKDLAGLKFKPDNQILENLIV